MSSHNGTSFVGRPDPWRIIGSFDPPHTVEPNATIRFIWDKASDEVGCKVVGFGAAEEVWERAKLKFCKSCNILTGYLKVNGNSHSHKITIRLSEGRTHWRQKSVIVCEYEDAPHVAVHHGTSEQPQTGAYQHAGTWHAEN